MYRCLQLANNALGNTYPNPLVGSVIVYKGKIIGEGYHRKAGEPHAEINAINSVKDKSLLKNSTLYVNLEPCAHYGKTPPCAVKIAEIGIPNVVIGTIDTTSKVNGKGVNILKNAGVNVITSILEKESRWLNRRFFTFHEKKRPYIILKWAQTIDGFIAPEQNIRTNIEPYWITGKSERTLVHKWRSQEQAILIGRKTLEYDNPQLNTRLWTGNNPLPIVLGKNFNFNQNNKLLDKTRNTLIISDIQGGLSESFKTFVKNCEKKDLVDCVLDYLYRRSIQSLIVEGGAFTHQQFIDKNLWDEARIFIGKKFFENGTKVALLKNKSLILQKQFRESNLFFFKNEK